MKVSSVVVACMLVGGVAAERVAAQAGDAAASGAVSAAAPSASAALSPALAKLQFAAAELPEGVVPGKDAPCISVQPESFFERPTLIKEMPAPVARTRQSFRQGKAALGTVLVLEYANDVPPELGRFLTGLLWGGDGGPTARHPEELLIHGPFIAILSFRQDEPQGRWFLAQMRERLGMPVIRDWSGLEPLLQKIIDAYGKRDAKAGAKLLADNADAIRDYAFAQYFFGEFSNALQDWPAAEEHYARAVELDDSGVDKLPDPPNLLWAALDGWGQALLFQHKDAAAVTVFERTVALGRQRHDDPSNGNALYNLACGLARLQRFDECLKALTESFQLAPELREPARKDTDLTEALARPEFRKLLGG